MHPMRRALVTTRVLEQVLLVVVLSREPVLRGRDLSDDLLTLGVEVLCLDLGGDALGGFLLFGGVKEDGGAVFCGSGSRWLVELK
jgi:hypothetical protein